jgi:hypothetical protein
MLYGSPSHRLEESLRTTSIALEIEGQYTLILTNDSSISVRSRMYDHFFR